MSDDQTPAADNPEAVDEARAAVEPPAEPKAPEAGSADAPRADKDFSAMNYRDAQGKAVLSDPEDVNRRADARLDLRMAPETVNEADRTVDLVVSTGAAVRRFDWRLGREYDEVLEISEKAIRMDRLNRGASFLDTHDSWAMSAVLGAVVPGSARVEGGNLVATVRFSDRPEADSVFRDVLAGVARHISVGYRIHKRTMDETKTPAVYRATDWEPFEVSLVPIPADPGAGFRSMPTSFPTPSAATAADNKERTDMADQTVNTPAVDEAAIRAEARKAERARVAEIRTIARKAGLGDAWADQHIDGGTEVDAARAAAIDGLAEKDKKADTSSIRMGEQNEYDTRAQAMKSAILHRYDPNAHKPENGAREYVGMTLMDMAREALEASGTRTRGMPREEIARRALQIRTAHSTSDFPAILADVANKTLRAGYEQAPRTFTAWARRTTAADFKNINRVQLGEAPELKKVNENGEFTRGTVGESKETYRLETFGRVITISRQVIVNDDLDAFTRIPALFGAAAAALESDTVYSILVANPTMSDGTALFHGAKHNNLSTGAAVPSKDAIGALRAKMRVQKGLDGKSVLNLEPRFLIAPSSLETTVESLLSPTIIPGTQDAVIPATMRSLTPVIEPRLETMAGGSATGFYLAADTGRIDTIEYAYLDGQEGVYIETRDGFDVDGVEIKARLDFGAAAIDWRGLQKHAGA